MDRWQATRTHDELAQHAEWLRGLARALVGDAAVADDLAQDAWLAFGTRALDADSARPFLARVVRRLAGKWRRGEGRRVARERDASRGEHVPSPDESLERLEMQELLVRMLKTLPEPYRGTLMLRYFDGLDAAEIARRTDVPAGTVRSRITRGLEELRARLDAHSRGDRREWTLALLPIANARHIAAGVGATSLGVIGAMSAKWIVASAALMLVALLVWRFESASVTSEDASSVASATLNDVVREKRDAVPEDGTAPQGGERSEVKSSEIAANAQLSTLTVFARFVDYAQAPIEGIALRAFVYERAPQYGVPAFTPINIGDLRHATSDSQGRVELEFDRASLLGTTFHARASGRGWTMKSIDSQMEAGDTIWLGDVELERGGSIVGRVVDANGAAIRGARVYPELSHPDNRATYLGPTRSVVDAVGSGYELIVATSDASGAFEFDGLREGHWTVWVLDIGRAWARRELIAVSHEQPGVVEVQVGPLDASHTISGRVLDPDGNPAAQIAITLRNPDGSWDSERQRYTLRDGSFAVFVDDSSARYELNAHDGVGRWAPIRRGNITAGTVDLEVSFAETAMLTVHVVEPSGEPVDQASVNARPVDGANGAFVPGCAGTSDPDGNVRFRRPDVPCSLYAEAQGFLVAQVGPLEPSDFGAEVVVTLERAPSLRGHVTFEGRAIQGAMVTLHRFAPAGAHFELAYSDRESQFVDFFAEPWMRRWVSTTRNGSFACSIPLDPFRWYLVASAPGFASVGRGPFEVEQGASLEGLDIELVFGGSVEGVVTTSLGGSPEGFSVYASNGLGCERGCSVGPDGRYRIDHLAPGAWQVRAFRFHRTASGTASEESAEAVTFDVEVRDGATTHFDVTAVEHETALFDGQLVVHAQPVGWWSYQIFDGDSLQMEHELHVSADGHFHLRIGKFKNLRIKLSSADPRWHDVDIVDSIGVVSPSAMWRCELAFARVSGFSATLREADVYCIREDSSTRSLRARFSVDADGKFDALVPAGPVKLLRVNASDASSGAELLTLNLAEGADEHIELP